MSNCFAAGPSAGFKVAPASPDGQVVEYLRTGLKRAEGQDERGRVLQLASDAESAAVRTAAETALDGDAAAIRAFLATGQHTVAAHEYRIEITRLVDGAGPGVTEAGRAVLDSNSTDRMRQFLTTGYFTARTDDERVRAVQLMESGGAELSAAAKVALAGPPDVLHSFIAVGQYAAQRADSLTATHVARVQRLISGAARVAATAQQNAALAQKVAAEARKAASEAAGYAQQASASAKQADEYAAQARASATAAEKSAAQAATSARTARTAEANAHAAARQAANSAARATASATAAQGSAGAAWQASNEARASANAADKSSEEAGKAADDAILAVTTKLLQEAQEALRNAEYRRDVAEAQAFEDALADLAAGDESSWWDYVSTGGHLLWYGAEGDAFNSGLSCAAAIPVIGWGATGGKWGKNGFSAIEAFGKSMRADGKVPHVWSQNPRQGRNYVQNAAHHWNKHRAEFPELTSMSEYVELAHRYSALGRDVVKKGQPVSGYRIYDQGSGRVGIYDKNTNTWTGINEDGVPQTMYKPGPYDPVNNPIGYRTTLEDWLSERGRGVEVN
ncbi:hypothetical protein ABZX85_11395 [Streptomyces sp. NPDC004539]|uniref:hypothetical protein n=1 Tax=Streptomyces sp. NPDC004539 TaxID=3154280 RepID=UPI0033B28BF1